MKELYCYQASEMLTSILNVYWLNISENCSDWIILFDVIILTKNVNKNFEQGKP
jgi:hypothetical protein